MKFSAYTSYARHLLSKTNISIYAVINIRAKRAKNPQWYVGDACITAAYSINSNMEVFTTLCHKKVPTFKRAVLQAGRSSRCPTNSVKALKAQQ